jgi:hypothetical protein
VDRLSKVLPRVLARQKRAGLLAEYRVRQAFRQVLGESLASACETIEVNGSTVWVTTANPALAHQLRLDAETLVARINAVTRLNRPVRSMNIRVGSGRGGGRAGRSV